MLKPLTTGEGVRIRHGNIWKPAIVSKKINDRSYVVTTQDGGMYRRNRRHLLKSNEKPFYMPEAPTVTQNQVNNNPRPPLSINRSAQQSVPTGTETAVTNQPQPTSPVKSQTAPNSPKSPQKCVERHENSTLSDHPINTAPSDRYTSRSGRIIKPPLKLDL